jgi:cytochrome c-type biogenesis protein CcmH/NrfG
LRQGQTFEAIPHLNEAVQSQPELTLTRARQAVQTQPNDPIAHFKLANALASLNQATNAVESLQTAVRLKTDFWEARYLLGVELAARGSLNEAQEQFAAVVQQRPDFARAHLNLGVALAQQMRLQEAAAAFANVVRIEPTNQAARQYLQQVNALTNRPAPPQSTPPIP